MNKASYWSKDVYEMLNIGSSTLRRWCVEMEKKGWKFEKDENGRRRFFERDVSALRSIKNLNEREGQSMDEAITQTVEEAEPNITGEHNIISQDQHNMLIERSEDVAQLALSIQTGVKELQEVFAKGYMDLKFENSELKDELAALRDELRVYIAATKEEKPEPGWIGKLANILKRSK